MPASRSARATTLAPRSWPSRPTLAMRTRMGVMSVAGGGGAPRAGAGDRRARGRRGAATAGTRRLQHLAHLGGKRIGRERLGEEGGPPLHLTVAPAGLGTYTRAQEP